MSILSFLWNRSRGDEIPPGFFPLAMIPITPKSDKTVKEITP